MSGGPYPPPRPGGGGGGGGARPVQPTFAATGQDLDAIPVADVVSGPPASGGPPQANQAAVPQAQMAYTVQGHARRRPPEQGVIVDPQVGLWVCVCACVRAWSRKEVDI